jgi:predicted glycosyltransferase
MAVLGIPTISVYQDALLDVDRFLLGLGAFLHKPGLTAPELLAVLKHAQRRPAEGALLEKGRQAYAQIKDEIING